MGQLISGSYYVRLGSNGRFVTSAYDNVYRGEATCGSTAALRGLVRRIEQIVPAVRRRSVSTAPEVPMDWDGIAMRLVQIVWLNRSGVRVANVGDMTELETATRVFLEGNPSFERRIRQRVESQEVPAASLHWHFMACGHCQPSYIRAIVRTDGLYFFENRVDSWSWSAGRFDPAQARAFYEWLRARQVLWLVGGENVGPQPRTRDGHPLLQVWTDATGLDLNRAIRGTRDYIAPR